MPLTRFCKQVVTADESDSAALVARKLRDHHVGSVVVTRRKRPIGIVTDRDLVVRLLAEGRSIETPIAALLTYSPFVVTEDDDIETAASYMREHAVRRLPIVDRTGVVTGMVTADDLLILLGREMADLCNAIEEGVDGTETT